MVWGVQLVLQVRLHTLVTPSRVRRAEQEPFSKHGFIIITIIYIYILLIIYHSYYTISYIVLLYYPTILLSSYIFLGAD